jgi:replicative DNA helicase
MAVEESEVGFELVPDLLYSDPRQAIERMYADVQTSRRIFTGIAPLDAETRGFSGGQLCLIVGYAHSGKTLVVLHVVANNPSKRIVLFTPDETAPLVWIKLACMMWGVSGAEMEARIAGDDPWARRALNETIASFPGLMVFDQPLTPRLMKDGYRQVCDQWGSPADLVVVDYLDLLSAGDSMGRADYVKNFGSEFDVPVIALHQTSRSAGSRGQEMRIDSGNYGGEQHATYLIGVWRKEAAFRSELAELETRPHHTEVTLDRMSWLRHEMDIHQYTVSLNLTKNKRPGGRRLDAIDFEMDLDTGVLTMLPEGNLPEQYVRPRELRSVQ